MTTPQYDAIGSTYVYFKSLPPIRVEMANLRAAVAPYVTGARVLDLACGAGHYSRLLLEWGASSVTGVDISPAMVAVAQREQEIWPEDIKKRLRFEVGDAATLGKLDGAEGFDLVTGIWLLNYAKTTEELQRMFETVLSNLKPGGVFVGVVPEPKSLAEMEELKQRYDVLAQRRWDAWAITVRLFDKVEEAGRILGWQARVQSKGNDGDQGVDFVNYHLGTEIYEEAARRAGLQGGLEWRTAVLDDDIKNQAAENDEGFWKQYLELGPHFGLVLVHKDS